MNLFDLTGKTAFLSGSSRGLGLAMAKALGLAGARILLNGRNEEVLNEAVGSLREAGIDAAGHAFDITDDDEAATGVAAVLEQAGQVDILVNNAGKHNRGPLEELSMEAWQDVIDLNLTAAFRLAQHFARPMIERGSGKIINIASLMAKITRPTTGNYTAAKGGLVLLTRAMTVEWARHNIQINAIGPGYFHTDMTDHLVNDPDFNGWITGRTPAGRWGVPDDLAGTIIFLASDASAYVNGQCIYVDAACQRPSDRRVRKRV